MRTGPFRIAALSLAIVAAQAVAPPASVATEHEGVADGLDTLGVWLGDLGSHDALSDPVPLTSLVPGGPEGLDLQGLFGDPGSPWRAALATATDLASVRAALEGITDADITVGDFTTADGVTSADIEIDVERQAVAPLSIVDDEGSVDLSTDLPDGLPLTLRFSFDFSAHWDTLTEEFWIGADPVSSHDAFVDADGDGTPDAFGFDVGDFGSVVGLTEVEVLPGGSSLELATHADITVVDSDGDGRLAFEERAADGTLNAVGELTLPKTENVPVDHAITTATGTIALGLPAGITVTGGGTPAVVISLESGAVAVTPNADFAQGIGKFANVDATDLLGGLGQLTNMLDSVQRDPTVDVDLPFVDLLLSQMLGTTDDVKRFVVAQTNGDDPNTVLNEFGTAQFETIQGFLEAVNASGTGLSIDTDDVVFDPATGQLDLPLQLFHDDGEMVPVRALLFDEFDPEEELAEGLESVRIGRPALGDALEQALGLTGLSPVLLDAAGDLRTTVDDAGQTVLDLAPPTAEVNRLLDVTIPWGVDLDPSEACTDCDLPETLDFEEAETLPTYRRFFVRDLDDGPEFQLDIASHIDASVLRGMAGFIELGAAEGSLIELGKVDDTLKSLTIDLAFPSELVVDDAIPVQQYVFHLTFDPDPDVVEPEWPSDDFTASDFAQVTNNLAATATLNLSTLGIDEVIPILGEDVVSVDLAWPTLAPIADVQLADLAHQVEVVNDTNALVQALGSIHFARGSDLPSSELALFASIIDTFAGLGTGLDQVLAGGDFVEDIPFLGGRPADLVEVFSQLDETADSLRNGELPGRLRDVLEALGTPDLLGSVPELRLVDLEDDGVLELVFDFAFDRAVDEALSLNSADLGLDLAGVETSGEVPVTGSVEAALSVPVSLELTDGPLPTSDVRIGRDSHVTMDVSALVDDTETLEVSALGQTLALGPGGEFRLGFGGTLSYTGTESGDYLSLQEFGGNFGGTLGGTADECANTDEDVAAVAGGLACVNMPVFFNGDPLTGNDPADPDDHWLQATWTDFSSAPTNLHTPEGIDAFLADQLLSFGSFGEGLDRLVDLLADLIEGQVFGVQVPLMEDLDGAADVADDLRAVRDQIAAVTDMADPTAPAVATVEDAFSSVETALGDALLDADGDSEDDFVVQAFCAGGNPCDDDAGDTAVDVQRVEVAMALGGTAEGSSDFDLGFEGIDFAGVGGQVAGHADWQVQLAFGVSRDDGFYLIDAPEDILYGGADHGDELSIGAGASLGAGGIDAHFGILGFRVSNRKDDVSGDEVGVALQGDLDAGDPSGRLAIVDLVGSDLFSTFNPEATIDADLQLTLEALTTVDGLPRVTADFDLGWEFTANQGGVSETKPLVIALGNPAFDVGAAFEEMFGPIFSRIHDVVEVADDIRSFVFAPIPVISDLSRTFGGGDITFVDLAEIFGDVDLGFLEDVDEVIRFIDAITSVGSGTPVTFAELAGLDPDTEELNVVFDATKVTQDKPAPTQVAASGLMQLQDGTGAQVGDGTIGSVDSMAGQMKQAAGDQDTVNDVIDDADTFSLPIVEEPGCILGMLGGGDCVLLDWTPRELYLGAEVEIPFGPFFGILYINIGGFAGAGIKFGMGFSTRGIRQAVERGSFQANPDAAIGNLLVEGIFIHDFEGPELYVNAGVYAEGEANVVIAAAGVRGGIEATLGFDLIDGPEMDGLVHLDEMARRIHNPLCLFEVIGFLEAFLQIYVEIGPCPFCVEEEFELARVKLLDFTARLAECDTDPTLAHVEDGTVKLNIGTRAPQRGTLQHIVDEQMTVREIRAPDPGTSTPGRFSVSAFGFTQEYEGYDIWFDAHTGDDVLLFQGTKAGASPEEGEAPPAENTGEQVKDLGDEAPFTARVVGFGGSGNDAITTGDGHDEVEGGSGDDQLTTGAGDDTVRGGPDDDQIDTGRGADEAFGEGGSDTINGGPGADTMLDGGPGDDRVDGGEHVFAEDGETILFPDGADNIAGGDDDDYLWGGPGNDRITGDGWNDRTDPHGDGAAGGGTDVIHGETGADRIWAGSGADVVIGDESEEPDEGATNDRIFGQGGGDALVGAWGKDTIHGGPDDDVINGGDDADDLFGDAGIDRVFGDVWGSLDAILLLDGRVDFAAASLPDDVDLSFLETDIGDPGRDEIDGGPDDDVLNGDAANDRIGGGEGDDYVNGGGGRDFIVGDDVEIIGNDGDAFADWDTDGTEDDAETMTGTFDDTIFGGPEGDEIYGEGGGDHVRGSSGDDLVFGNAGEDVLHGDVDEDEVYGGADDDRIEGGPDDDLLLGNEDDDTIFGQAGNDRIVGGSGFLRSDVSEDGDDRLHGGAGTDVILGDNGEIPPSLDAVDLVPATGGAPDGDFGDDVLVGDGNEDTLHGQDGDDELYGGTADDQLFGELGGDELYGQGGHDHLVGDRGLVGDGTDGDVAEPRLAHEAHTFWPAESGDPADQGAPRWAVELLAANTQGGEDLLDGGLGDDHLYAGAANDVLRGQLGDDWMEGNGGQDTMHGLSDDPMDFLLLQFWDDQDVMLGGSSDVNPADDKLDEGELVMHGNSAQDVMLGDNGNVDRLMDPAGTAWLEDPITGGHAREVELLDRDRRTPADDLDLVSGDDLMHGDDGNDRMYGEGGQDLLQGNADDDQLQGNQGRDILEGNDGDDDLIGGTDLVADFVPDAPSDLGDPDDGDWLFGGADADVIAGDNAIITRTVVAGSHYYETDLIGVTAQRGVDLLDVEVETAENAGPDQVSGGSGVDAMFGQDDRDHVTGNGDDDYMEGNGDGDFLWGDLALADADGHDPPEVFGASFPVVDITPIDHPLVAHLSGDAGLFGPPADDGQDDQIGGWSQPGHRDGGDMVFGDGAQDFQLGDNGTLTRTIEEVDGQDAYVGYVDYRPDTAFRAVERFDVGDDDGSGSSADDPTSGNDWLQGDDEDDYQWGQDGDDTLFGDDLLDGDDVGNDDMLGELDDDTMFGGPGEDAMLGDRGTIDNTLVPDGPSHVVDTGGPAFFHYEALLAGQLDRRVDLLLDEEGQPLEYDGIHFGGRDFMRGGPDHDSMHGGFADDWMNGDDGADWMFGDYGDDAMWGGGGTGDDDEANPVHDEDASDELFNSYVDILFGGYGEDILDFRPRPEGVPGHADEPIWREITGLDDADPTNDQHHQGVDWIYGGFDRDVLQGNVGQNGPEEFGDRLIDWVGAYNLYTRCNPSYGDDGDIRQRSPALEQLIWTMAFGSGVGATLDDVTTPGTSAFEELGFVYKQDNQENSGPAHDGTPGHFFEDACETG